MDISPVTASQATTTQPAQSSAFSSLTDNIDTFLTLLTTQLQNQNPLDPLDTEQFTQQLVQFASVEQSIQTNTNLETLIALQTTTDRSAALDLIDRTISVNTDVAALEANGAEWTFQTASSGAPLTLTITNPAGEVVRTASTVSTGAEQAFAWDGLRSDGSRAPDGAYRLAITSADGNSVNAAIRTSTRVDGVSFTSEGARLETPLGLITLDSIARAGARRQETAS